MQLNGGEYEWIFVHMWDVNIFKWKNKDIGDI